MFKVSFWEKTCKQLYSIRSVIDELFSYFILETKRIVFEKDYFILNIITQQYFFSDCELIKIIACQSKYCAYEIKP